MLNKKLSLYAFQLPKYVFHSFLHKTRKGKKKAFQNQTKIRNIANSFPLWLVFCLTTKNPYQKYPGIIGLKLSAHF